MHKGQADVAVWISVAHCLIHNACHLLGCKGLASPSLASARLSAANTASLVGIDKLRTQSSFLAGHSVSLTSLISQELHWNEVLFLPVTSQDSSTGTPRQVTSMTHLSYILHAFNISTTLMLLTLPNSALDVAWLPWIGASVCWSQGNMFWFCQCSLEDLTPVVLISDNHRGFAALVWSEHIHSCPKSSWIAHKYPS